MTEVNGETRPRIAITLGDVTGIGPEVLARAWATRALTAVARPLVIGRAEIVRHWAKQVDDGLVVERIETPEQAEGSSSLIPVLEVDGGRDSDDLETGRIDARAGRAAHDFLVSAAGLALAGRIDAITTLPLHKEALHAAGVAEPGHTEILARLCGGVEHAMMLYVAPPTARGPAGLGVVHATLHMALRDVFAALTVDRVRAAIGLADRGLRPFTEGRTPRVAVAGLNPHAGENGLFGDEEQRIIEPAVAAARVEGCDVVGPIAADTLFARAFAGDFDAVVAMYHDQGHVAVKTVAFRQAVNVTLGLPIVRTSVAHGTAHDIVGRGVADPASLIEAVRVAAKLAGARSDLVSVARSRPAATP